MPLLSRRARRALLACVLALTAGAVSAQAPPDAHARWYADYVAHARLVPVGRGRSLNLYCLGAGAPTVILESGLSESADTWWRVQPALGKLTRVCAYDRAGLGRSPPGPLPRDTRAEVGDLEALLRAAGLKGPYVLVGHSMGGYNMRVFAARHRAQTAGLVLVDSSVENQLPHTEAAIPSIAENDARSMSRTRACADPARTARVAGLCARAAPEGFPPDLAKAFTATYGLTAAQTRLSEMDSFVNRDSDEVSAEARPLGATPVVVLTRGALSTDLPPQDAALEWTMWKAMHDGLVKLSARSVQRVIEGAGHYIQQDRPEAVIQAVSDVVGCARKPGSCALN